MATNLGFPILAEAPRPPAAADNGYAALGQAQLESSRVLLAGLGDMAKPLGCVLVTRAGPGGDDVSVGLATAVALQGQRVLLMECDLERPVLAGRLGLRAAPGLREYLAWEATAPELLQPLDLAGSAVGGDSGPTGQLVCIVAGGERHDAAGLIATYSFAGAMRKVRKAYDLVVLAGGPIGAEELPLIARHADAIAICAAERQVTEGDRGLERALSRLPVKPVGLVLVGEG